MNIFATAMLRVLWVLLLSSIAHFYSAAQTPALWGALDPGPYDVGFTFIYKQDHSRGWKAKEDTNGYPQGETRRRPIRISVWYPGRRQSNAPRMFYRDYMPLRARSEVFSELNNLLKKRDVGNLRANLKAEEFDSLMKMRMAVVVNALPQTGAFPLLVYSAGLNNSSHDNFVLCEYLASHGYVVITVAQLGTTSLDVNLKFPSVTDLETQILDLYTPLAQCTILLTLTTPNWARSVTALAELRP
jgi:Platelet-activating factor acetylhydrolase, isoform II